MTYEHPIAMLLHQSEYLLPGVGYASGTPVVYGSGFNVEDFCQSSNASSGLYGLVEDLHGADDITKVSDAKHFCASIIEPMSILAQRLKEARLAKGPLWTQKHLAVAAGVSTGTIGMMESGKRGNKESIPGTTPQIAKALGVRFEWLAYGQEPRFEDEVSIVNSLAHMEAELQRRLMEIASLLNSVPVERQTEAYIAATQTLIRYLPGAFATPLLTAPAPSKKPLA